MLQMLEDLKVVVEVLPTSLLAGIAVSATDIITLLNIVT
jgi:hypothetical protein